MARLPRDEAKPALAFATLRFNLDGAALGMPALLEAPGTKLTYLAPMQASEHQEREAIKVEFDAKDTLRAGTTFQLLVAKDTHLITQLEILDPKGTIGYSVSGWTDVGGLKFPTLEHNLGESRRADRVQGHQGRPAGRGALHAERRQVAAVSAARAGCAPGS